MHARIIAPPPQPEEEEEIDLGGGDDDDDDDDDLRKEPKRGRPPHRYRSIMPDREELAELVLVLTALRRLIGRQNISRAILRSIFAHG
jgi:hypothetical protein